MSQQQTRHDFLGLAFGGVAAIGGVFALRAMKKTWGPLPSVQAAGFTTINLLSMELGELRTIKWRKKPIFILCKDANTPVNDNW